MICVVYNNECITDVKGKQHNPFKRFSNSAKHFRPWRLFMKLWGPERCQQQRQTGFDSCPEGERSSKMPILSFQWEFWQQRPYSFQDTRVLPSPKQMSSPPSTQLWLCFLSISHVGAFVMSNWHPPFRVWSCCTALHTLHRDGVRSCTRFFFWAVASYSLGWLSGAV